MFTGLVEDVGSVTALHRTLSEVRLSIASACICQQLAIGDSVSVNGACLTVVATGNSQFTVLATAETLRRTSLRTLSVGSFVNLERALRLGDRLGGHLVLGHVDGVGTVQRMVREGEALRMEVEAPTPLHPLLVSKGSIAVDGISLTIASLLPIGFSVALIPHTLGVTTLQSKREGDPVNLETDIIGKYVAHLLRLNREVPGVSLPSDSEPVTGENGVSLNLLKEYGFA